MKQKWCHLVFLLLVLMIVGCSSSEAPEEYGFEDDASVGTIITNPKPPTKVVADNIFPDFDAQLPGLMEKEKFPLNQVSLPLENNVAVRTMLIKIFNMGSIREFNSELLLQELRSFGYAVQNQMNAEGVILPPTGELQVTISKKLGLLGYVAKAWQIRILPEQNHDGYTRLYFINPDKGDIQASYVYKTSSDGQPIKGMLGFASPKALDEDLKETEAIRLLVIAFDFSSPDRNVMTIRVDRLHDVLGSLAGQSFIQCHLGSSVCVAEHQEIFGEAPLRVLAKPIVRYSWEDKLDDVCFASMDYSENHVQMSAPLYFEINSLAVTKQACDIPTPIWGAHSFSVDDLLMRADDTDPLGGTARLVFTDGQSTEGWETYVDPALIDVTLDGSGLMN